MKKLSRLLGTVLLLLSCSTVAMATPFLFELPDPYGGGGGGRYAFTWSGELQGLTDPYSKFNGEKFTLSGYYFSNGTFDFTRMEVFLPPPELGGSGNLVALPDPDVGGPGSLFLPNPWDGGGGSIIALIPRFEITTLPDGTRTALFRSLDFNDTAGDFTISNHMYQAAPVPEPSTILLFAAGLAGLTAFGRRRKV